ncbi:biotin biosynthesis protein BioY [Bifidobacterium margollesii]|uniref:Biotin transporter n=1 Tax=Bifidobacterium margollesii TaxID=2020964 RepID=A0A2N5JCL5_9BIFI|nr:biotin transporter BioY [Bifidobacterium margollesii]PLS31952.1 biotin biosynthesis protein BioY [Bifidobacterium margollesii]
MNAQHHDSKVVESSNAAPKLLVSAGKVALFAVLMWAAAAAGAIPIPGTPVPITLQTFVVMLAGLTLSWREAGSSVALYLAAGAAGLPVFAGGASTMALFGPSAGFLLGFLPGAIVIAALKGRTPLRSRTLTALRYFGASLLGGVVVVYAFGCAIQSALTGVPLIPVVIASMGFIIGDLVKAAVASLACAGLIRRK